MTESRVPRLAFDIRLREDLKSHQLSHVVAEEVKIEAGFESFSSLVVLSVPMSLMAYLPTHSALILLRPVTSCNKLLSLVPDTAGFFNYLSPRDKVNERDIYDAALFLQTSQASDDENLRPGQHHSIKEGSRFQANQTSPLTNPGSPAEAALDLAFPNSGNISNAILGATMVPLAGVSTEDPNYQACHRYFLDCGQHSALVKNVAAFINIPAIPEETIPEAVSLVPFIRRHVCTGKDLPLILSSFFGEYWKLGIGFLNDTERQNLLFIGKSTSWAKVKSAYIMADGQYAPFLAMTQAVTESEPLKAETS
jgi:hypothetical protein